MSPTAGYHQMNDKVLLHDPDLVNYIRVFEYEKKNFAEIQGNFATSQVSSPKSSINVVEVVTSTFSRAMLRERELIEKYVNAARLSPRRRGVGGNFGLPRRPEPLNL
jgi:hypothetical protein